MRAEHAVSRRLRPELSPDVFEAFRRAVHTYGVQRLAPLMGVRPGTLYNKADAGEDTHNQPTLRDVVQVTQFTGDMQILDALNQMFGRVAFDCLPMERASDEDLLELLTTLGVHNGAFQSALREGLRGERFTVHALRHVRAQAFDIVSALMTLLYRLEDFVDESQPDTGAP